MAVRDGTGLLDRVTLGTLGLELLPRGEAWGLLDRWAEAGGRGVDTAAAYGAGRVEALVGAWLRQTAAGVEVVTKIGYFADPASYRDVAAVDGAVERAVERLGRTPAAVLLHEADWGCWWREARPGELLRTRPERPPAAWERLVELGRRHGFAVGVAGNNAGPMLAAYRAVAAAPPAGVGGPGVRVLLAKQHDLLWRAGRELLELGVHLTLASPFHQGALLDLPGLAAAADRAGDAELAAEARRLSGVLRGHGRSPAAVAVPFLLAEPGVRDVCVGLRSGAELTALLDHLRRARRFRDSGLRAELRALGLVRPPRPGPLPIPAGARPRAAAAAGGGR